MVDDDHAAVAERVGRHYLKGLLHNGVFPGKEVCIFPCQCNLARVGAGQPRFRQFRIMVVPQGFETDGRMADHTLGWLDQQNSRRQGFGFQAEGIE